MRIHAIAVVGSNGIIGDGRDQPFKLKADWARFKRTTMGHCMVMGRKTYDAMGPLPGRTAIVITRDTRRVRVPDVLPAGARVEAVASLDEAFARAEELGDDCCYVTGGGQIYTAALDRCDVLDLTEVHADAPGTVRFPDVDPAVWREVLRDPVTASDPSFDFVRYERR